MKLNDIVNIVHKSNYYVQNDTLFCNGYVVENIKVINEVEENGLIENIISEIKEGGIINLEFTISKLKPLGFFISIEDFIKCNKYSIVKENCFLLDINDYSTANNDTLNHYTIIVSLINTITKTANHEYSSSGQKHIIINSEDRTLLLIIDYSIEDINDIDIATVDLLKSVIEVLDETNSEKKLLYFNELTEFLSPINEEKRFKYLLSYFKEFSSKCEDSYKFYLRNFSSTKLKIEIDSKVLEYTQKIQSVINESQTKLIAIPTAFVLVFATFEFHDLISVKNIASIVGLIIFAVLIQLFINNQKSALRLIKEDFMEFNDSYLKSNITSVSKKLSVVGTELQKQKTRIFAINIILWAIPTLLFSAWLTLLMIKYISMHNIVKALLLIHP